eukprot:UN23525
MKIHDLYINIRVRHTFFEFLGSRGRSIFNIFIYVKLFFLFVRKTKLMRFD